MEDANLAFNLLGLPYGQRDLVLGVVVGVGEIEFRGTGAVDPLMKEAVDADVRGFLDSLD